MMLIFYFLLIRPQQKRQKEHDAMLRSLRKGSIVRTTGGIRGEGFSLDDTEAVLIIADRVKVNVLRTHIQSVAPSAEEEKKQKEEAEAKKKDAEKKKKDADEKKKGDDEDEDDED